MKIEFNLIPMVHLDSQPQTQGCKFKNQNILQPQLAVLLFSGNPSHLIEYSVGKVTDRLKIEVKIHLILPKARNWLLYPTSSKWFLLVSMASWTNSWYVLYQITMRTFCSAEIDCWVQSKISNCWAWQHVRASSFPVIRESSTFLFLCYNLSWFMSLCKIKHCPCLSLSYFSVCISHCLPCLCTKITLSGWAGVQ